MKKYLLLLFVILSQTVSYANDDCANAIQLIPGTECTYTTGSFSGATLSGIVPSCAASATQDVWYKFTATSKTMSVYVERSSSNWDMYFALEIFEDTCNGNQFKCIASRLNYSNYYNTDFVIGKTYFLRVANTTSINSFSFKLCVQALPTPANDECANATELFPTSDCNYTTGTFSGALLNTTVPSCAASATQDVWYKFTATSKTMSVYVERSLSNWDMYFALEIFEDTCNGNQFKCIASRLNYSNYYNTDFVIGKTYFLRVANTTSINSFSFKLCVQALPSPVNDSCLNATVLTPANTCTPVSGTFSGALLENTVSTCASNTSQDVWYKFTATGETMSVFVERASFNWTMYFAFEILEDSCSGNQFSCTATGQNSASFQATNFVVGKTYYIRLINASAGINSFDFRICLTGPPPVTCTPSVFITASTAAICQGASISFTATTINGGAVPSYQWKANGNNVGTNSPVYTTTSLTNGSIVTCLLTSNATCASPLSVMSNAITVNVSSLLTPEFAPIAPICSGTSLTLPTTSENGITGIWSPSFNNTATTTYTFTPTAGQCASTSSLTVAVIHTVAEVIVQGNTLTASTTGATYQWLNCSTNQPISGATTASYTATTSGSYAVIVNQNGCSKTSACVTVSTLGMDTFARNGWTTYPNPATEQLFIELKQAAKITIVDANGKAIRSEPLKAGTNVLNISSLMAGVYFLKSSLGTTVQFIKR